MKKKPTARKKSVAPVPVAANTDYDQLFCGVSHLLEEARRTAARSVNLLVTATYGELGRRLVEFEQAGQDRAAYGDALLTRLSADLTARFGRGFSPENLRLMRLFYLRYRERISQTASGELAMPAPQDNSQTLSGKFPLSWSHYVRLLPVDELHKRDFYEEEARRARWSVRELDRQINSMLYERLALSRDKAKLLEQAERAGERPTLQEEIRDPYVLEFLGLPEPYDEKDLETALIQHLAEFLLELGFGFAFLARQKRLQVGSESYYLDLLLYHRRLRCLVAIDLKAGKLNHADVGQMNLYLNYLRENETLEDESPPVGLILCSEKDEAVAHYALGQLNNKVFASRYQLQLPAPEVLQREIEAERRRLEQRLNPSRPEA